MGFVNDVISWHHDSVLIPARNYHEATRRAKTAERVSMWKRTTWNGVKELGQEREIDWW